MKTTTKAVLLGLCIAMPSLAWSNPVLTISGKSIGGDRASVEFSAEDLAGMEQATVKTANDYVDGVVTFSGPLFRTVLSEFEFGPDSTITVTAVNDYSVGIPANDILDYDVILATAMNGAEMSVRDRGPIWVIYPMTDNPELQDALFNDRLIWQLTKVDVKP